jgi:hypothetical protein
MQNSAQHIFEPWRDVFAILKGGRFAPGYHSQGQFKAQNGNQSAQFGTERFANADPFCSVLKPFSDVPVSVSRNLKPVDCLFTRQPRLD